MRSGLELMVMPLASEPHALSAHTPVAALAHEGVLGRHLVTGAAVSSLVVEARGFGDGLLNMIVSLGKMMGGDDLGPRLSLIVSNTKKRRADAVFFGQFDCGVLDAIGINNPMCAGRVEKLFLAGSPAAVFRAIALRVVDAVDGVLGRRLRAHVGNEVGKAHPSASIEPTITDENASRSVLRIGFEIGVVAALAHSVVAGTKRMFLAHVGHGYIGDATMQGEV